MKRITQLYFQDGLIYRWQVKVNGTLAVSFPAGFIQLLHQHLSGTKYVDDLKFSVLNSGQLTRAVTNSEVLQS